MKKKKNMKENMKEKNTIYKTFPPASKQSLPLKENMKKKKNMKETLPLAIKQSFPLANTKLMEHLPPKAQSNKSPQLINKWKPMIPIPQPSTNKWPGQWLWLLLSAPTHGYGSHSPPL